jgi:hypothetical protein
MLFERCNPHTLSSIEEERGAIEINSDAAGKYGPKFNLGVVMSASACARAKFEQSDRYAVNIRKRIKTHNASIHASLMAVSVMLQVYDLWDEHHCSSGWITES